MFLREYKKKLQIDQSYNTEKNIDDDIWPDLILAMK